MALERVIVLGCGGFVGSHLVDRLLADQRVEIHGWDVNAQRIAGHLGNPRLHYHESYVDGTNTEEQLGPYVGEVDAVVSLAAVCNPAEYMANPLFTIRSNFIDAYRLVDLCAKHGTWLLHTSTCEVYGRTLSSYVEGEEYRDRALYEQVEDRTPLVMGPIRNQRWTYATAKQLFERYLYAHHTEQGLPFTIVRPYNWFGPRMDFIPGRDGEGVPRVLACFMTALLDRKPLQLVDEGQAYRTITYISDAIDALELMLRNPGKAQGNWFNVGNRAGEVTMAQLARLMRETYAEITGDPSYRNHPIENVSGLEFYGPGYEDCDRRVPDVSRAEQLLGWKAGTSLRDTLRVTMKYFHDAYAVPRAGAPRKRRRLSEYAEITGPRTSLPPQ